MVKLSLACGLQERLAQSWGNDDFSDFTVVVENNRYQCHRFILRACSEFFYCLFRSEMREKHESCIELSGMTTDIFDIIINSVYKGVDGLTQENLISVWKAVHLLQMDYLITECEELAMKTMSIDNYLEFYDCAKLLQSEKVVIFSHDFMINNFNHFRYTETFLDLTADELYMMIESHNLNIIYEVLVIESILRWVAHVPKFSPATMKVVCESSEDKQKYSPSISEDVDKETGDNDDSEGSKSDQLSCNDTEDTVSTGNQHDVAETEAAMKVVCESFEEKQKYSPSFDEDVDKENGDNDDSVGKKLDQLSCNNTEDTVSTGNQQVTTDVTETEGHVENIGKLDVGLTKEGLPLKGGTFVTDKNRVTELGRFFSVARLCLLRPDYLQTLIKNPITSDNREIATLLHNVQAYQQKACHKYWPLSALHRACSDMTHGMVYIDSDRKECRLYSLDKGSTHVLCKLPDETDDMKVTLAISDQMLILGQTKNRESRISICANPIGWTKDTGIIRTDLDKLFCHNHKVYVICRNSDSSKKNYPDCPGQIIFDTIESQYTIRAAISYNQYILLFTVRNFRTAVLCYHSPTKKISSIINVGIVSPKIISFHCKENIYVLEPEGKLYLLTAPPENADVNINSTLFQFVAELWDSHECQLHGAVVYKDELFIFGYSVPLTPSVPYNPDFKAIRIIQIGSSSECLPMIVPKSWLK